MTEESSPAWTLTRNVLQYYSALLVLPSELAPTQQLRSFVGSIRPFWTFLIFLHYHWFCEALRCCCTWQSAGYCGHSVCSPTAMYNCGAGGPPYLALLAVKLYYIAPALHTCNSHCPPWQSGLVKTPRFNLHLQTVLKYVRFFLFLLLSSNSKTSTCTHNHCVQLHVFFDRGIILVQPAQKSWRAGILKTTPWASVEPLKIDVVLEALWFNGFRPWDTALL